GAGGEPGKHLLEVDVSLEELAAILGEELELPRIQPRGRDRILADRGRYSSIGVVGPESLRHFRRTYREALKRQIAEGLYDPQNPVIIPIRRDLRYRTWRPRPVPESAAVVFYIMDVSGSMGDEQKEIVRLAAFWIDTWLRSQYKGVETRYIAHDAAAREVPRDMFFRLRESGGTKISSAYELVRSILAEHYVSRDWNLYILQFSDGDNWGADDTGRCAEILQESLLPVCNLFAYGQVRSAYGSGQFLKDLKEKIQDERLVTAEIPDREHILDALKAFLGKGR
ncbi:MAG: DUF444 family protein, partial [Planctomycetes bacterium]|nr:DUF444 family protein [Planctomycetota bacterium]